MVRRSSRVLLPFLLAGCLTPTLDTESTSWGIGPDPACDPSSSTLCWPDADRLALGRADEDVLAALDDPSSPAALQSVVGEAEGLAHRYDAEDLLVLDQVEQAASSPDPAIAQLALARLTQDILAEQDAALLETYLAPIEDEVQGAYECPSGAACALGWGSRSIVPEDLPPAAQEVLRALEQTGVLGKTYVAVIIASHVLERDSHAANEQLFDGAALTAEDEVARIVERAKRLAQAVGAVTGGVSALGPVGIGISIGMEEWYLMQIQLDALFRIADVYGVSLKNDRDALMGMLVWMATGELEWSFASALPKLGTYLSSRFGAMLLANGVRGAVRGLIGTLTLGIVSATGNVLLAGQRAESRAWGSAFLTRDWIGGLARLGSVQGDATQRTCTFRIVALAAVADGQLSGTEAELYMTLMATARNGAAPLDDDELVSAAAKIPDAMLGGLWGCDDTLRASPPGVRGSAVGLAAMTAAADGISPSEASTLEDIERRLGGIPVVDPFDFSMASLAASAATGSLWRRQQALPGATTEALTGVVVPANVRSAFATGTGGL